MSVQAGVWNLDDGPPDERLLEKLSGVAAQYGPDGENMHFAGSVGMLYRPFHTTQESRREHQPHVSPRGYVITWDGRLDNREDLLPQLGCRFISSQTDIAIVSAAFERWGTDCFLKLVGDWALAIWDPQAKTLLLARDFLGVRHLYYLSKPNTVIWSTHLSPLALCGDQFTLCDEYIAGYFGMYAEAHLTPYREIHAVPPGGFIRIRNGVTTVHRYWSFRPQLRTHHKTDAEYEEQFRLVFRQAVRRRLRSDSPILADLSGGLDSSSIVCMADDILSREGGPAPRLDTLSFYDPLEPGGDERPYVSCVEEKRGRKGHHINKGKVTSSYVLPSEVFVPVPGCLGGGGESMTALAEVKKMGGYRVVLSGTGGDEFLGGIPDPRPQLADLIVRFRLGALMREIVAWSLAKRRPWIQILVDTLVFLLPPSARASFAREGKISPWINAGFARRCKLAVHQLGPQGHFGFWLPSRWEFAQTVAAMARQMSWTPLSVVGCDEKRYPYLDQTLIEFLASTPANQILRPGQRRSLMRRSLSGLVPNDVLNRKTKALIARRYMVALDLLSSELEVLFERALTSQFGYMNSAQFLEELRSTRAGNPRNLVRVLRGLSLELWLRDAATRGIIVVPDRPAVSPSVAEFASKVAIFQTGRR